MSLLRYKFANNVRVNLTTSITNAQNTITFNAAAAPYNNLPDPAGDAASGGIGIATLFDNYQFPTALETVTYTSLTNNGNGTYTISGVVRAVDGTTAQAFPAGATMIQALSVAAFNNPAWSTNNDGSGNQSNVSLMVKNTGPDSASLGSELTTNGTFTGNAAGWTLGADWAYSANNVVLTLAPAGMGTLSQNINVVSGVSYLVSWTQQHSVANDGKILPKIGTASGVNTGFANTSVNTSKCVIVANATGTLSLSFTPQYVAAGTITIDNVSVVAITPSAEIETLKTSAGNYAAGVRADSALNISVGANALQNIVAGTGNVAFGNSVLKSNTEGSNNVGVGNGAISNNVNGGNNTALGASALGNNTFGSSNVAIGSGVLSGCVTGSNNIGLGLNAISNVTSGNNNVGIGASVQIPDSTGVASGQLSIQNIIYGWGNTGFGLTPSTGRIGIGTNVDDGTNRLQVTGGIVESSGVNGIGYSTGAGGTITQATNKSTGVTLNKTCGQITMNAASLAASTSVSFTLTNSTIAATDVVLVSIASGATAGSYVTGVQATAAGSCSVHVRNISAGALAEALVLNFAVIKAVLA